MSKNDKDAERSALESALMSLHPADVQWSRDELLYAAGMETAKHQYRRRAQCWKVTSGVLMLVCCGLSVSMLWPKESIDVAPVVDRVPEVDDVESSQAAAMDAEPEGESRLESADDGRQYSRLRRVVLIEGVDALPERTMGEPGRSPPIRPDSRSRVLLRELLES